ncbi:MAG: RHS repeat-associated core domain-containing protein [Nitrospiraceae bacterium]
MPVLNGNHGRPTQVTSGTLLTTQFKHNGRGERVWVDNVGGTYLPLFPDKTLHFDESGRVLAEHWPGGVMYEYLYVDEVPVAFVKYDGTNGGGTGTVYYYHSDHLNTPRYATDAAGTLVWASGFPGEDPFRPGSMSAYGLNLEPRLRFPGQYYQAETGAVYNYFRDYDPVTGRYLQADPIGLAGGLNTYAYANNNSLRYTDPFGLESISATFGGGLHYGTYGANASTSIGIDSKGKVCFQFTKCGQVGFGRLGSLGAGITASESDFCEGDSFSEGPFAEAGAGIGAGGSATEDTIGSGSIAGLKGFAGGGAAAGKQYCTTRTVCLN